MPHPIHILSNGLRLIINPSQSPISHFGILINAGTRDEPFDKGGLAHFVEHTIFKGTQKRNARQILARLENVGGEMNASTSKEETHFYASFLTSDTPRALELMADIITQSTFPKEEIAKEKDVVLEEIKYYEDTPTELIFDHFETMVFKNHPLGRNILGTQKEVKKLKREDILNFTQQLYQTENMVLSYCGSMNPKKVMALCERYFASVGCQATPTMRAPFEGYTPETLRVKKRIHQGHLITGNIGYPIGHPRRPHLLLLTNLLGGQGSNTRLNLSIREKHGYAYHVEANSTPFTDSGLFSIYVGCHFDSIQKCLELIQKELKKINTTALGTLQLHYAKKQFLGQLAISNESKINEMFALGRSALFFKEVETLEESIAEFEKITANELLEVANEIFDFDRFSTLIYQNT